MRIVFVIKAMEGANGGAERVFSEVTAGLARRGHAVYWITFDRAGSRPFYPLGEGVEWLALGIGNTRARARPVETLRRMAALRRTLREVRPDVAVGFMHSMFVPLSLAMLGTKIPVVGSEHIVADHYRERRLEFLLVQVCGLLVCALTVLSERIRRTYPRWLWGRMVVVPDPVAEIAGSGADVGGRGKRKIVLCVGRLDVQKDQATAIRAFAELAEMLPEWDLRIVGEGALRGDLERLVRELGLEGRVFLPGATSDIGQEYREAQLYGIPSLYEGFGLATAEAMAHGLPAVGFADCPGTNELIIDGRNGLLVRGRDRERAFAEGLRRLMVDERGRCRLGAAARSGLEGYRLDRIVKQWEELLVACAGTGGQRARDGGELADRPGPARGHAAHRLCAWGGRWCLRGLGRKGVGSRGS